LEDCKTVPQGLKPSSTLAEGGTAEALPFVPIFSVSRLEAVTEYVAALASKKTPHEGHGF